MTKNDFFLIDKLVLQGFRAYLSPRVFDFDTRRCLAVFAPNGSGKSSIIDALEFMFSEDGTLQRLGIRAINNQAGPVALAHNLADAQKLVPQVSIRFRRGQKFFEGSRTPLGPSRPRPQAASLVSEMFAVDPIIRGHSLRSFVEEHTAEQRYADVARWLGFGPLVSVQRNLRLLRQQVKAAAEDRSEITRIGNQIARETGRQVGAWIPIEIVEFINSRVLSPLDKKLRMQAISTDDAAYKTVVRRARLEERQLGLDGLKQLRRAAVALHEEAADHQKSSKGLIAQFNVAIASAADAVAKEKKERAKAANAAFSELWNAANAVISDNSLSFDKCPLCDTAIKNTKAGGRDGILQHVSKHLVQLADYAAAKSQLDRANTVLGRNRSSLVMSVETLRSLLSEEYKAVDAVLDKYLKAIKGWQGGAVPESNTVTQSVRELVGMLDLRIDEIVTRQGEHTYNAARAKLDRIVALGDEQGLAVKTLAHLDVLSNELTEQAAHIAGEIRKALQGLLDALESPMNRIYRGIQADRAVPVRLELPAEDDRNQQRLSLVVDFASNRVGVQPSGYLSDSQIHSLALALRLAAVKRANGGARIVALDDVVTSYDADHRRSIAAVLGAELENYQIIITTHDERFFIYLKDQLAANEWQFLRITTFDSTFGPHFSEHKVSDDLIEKRWIDGESAANEIRQAEEEWLLAICRDFGVSVRIKLVERAHSYERSELAAALARFLRDVKLTPPAIHGVNNRFLGSLQQGVVENFGSHFQDGLYGDGSIGDEKTRWNEFRSFRKQFVCGKCGRSRFRRPNEIRKPICANEKCETPFEFVLTGGK